MCRPERVHFDVLIMGAGRSGIDAAHRLQKFCPNNSDVILEQRNRIAGIWDLFRIPGIRSDSVGASRSSGHNQIPIDLDTQPGTLRHGKIALLIDCRWFAENRKALAVVANGRVVVEFQ